MTVQTQSETQAQRIARHKRTELLDAAVDELIQHGWRGLQMQAVARRVGVSRQTVYNTFSGRDGLAEAMIAHLSDSFLDGFGIAFGAVEPALPTSPAGQWEAGIRYLLLRASEDAALRAMLGLDSRDQFLGLLTSRSEPIMVRARERVPHMALAHQPGLDRTRLTQVAELLARLTLSQIVQPIIELDATVFAVTEMVTRYLGIGTGDTAGAR